MPRSFFFVVALLVALSGCVHTEFYPDSAVPSPQVARSAVRFYDADAPTIVAAGGVVIGRIGASGGRWTDVGDLAEKSKTEAAEHGGTHIILTRAGSSTHLVQHAGSSQTTCSGYGNYANCNSTYTPPSTSAYHTPHASLVVVRVPPENWGQLPEALRPMPND